MSIEAFGANGSTPKFWRGRHTRTRLEGKQKRIDGTVHVSLTGMGSSWRTLKNEYHKDKNPLAQPKVEGDILIGTNGNGQEKRVIIFDSAPISAAVD